MEKFRGKVISFNMAKMKWLSRKEGTVQRNQLWITLTLTANQSAADVVFRSASHFDFESLIFQKSEPDRWKGTHRNTVMRFHLLDEYATVICARSRSQRIISTHWLPEIIREMETVVLTAFIYSRLCDITHWISNSSLNRFYKISGVISNYKFEFEISKSAKIGRNLWGDITFKCKENFK